MSVSDRLVYAIQTHDTDGLDEEFAKLAISLARLGGLFTSPCPKYGAVLAILANAIHAENTGSSKPEDPHEYITEFLCVRVTWATWHRSIVAEFLGAISDGFEHRLGVRRSPLSYLSREGYIEWRRVGGSIERALGLEVARILGAKSG